MLYAIHILRCAMLRCENWARFRLFLSLSNTAMPVKVRFPSSSHVCRVGKNIWRMSIF